MTLLGRAGEAIRYEQLCIKESYESMFQSQSTVFMRHLEQPRKEKYQVKIKLGQEKGL